MRSNVDSPRILYVAEECAFNVANGSHVRCVNVVRALQQIGRVEVVTLSDPSDTGRTISEARREINFRYALETQSRPNEGLIAKIKWTFDAEKDYPRGYGLTEEGWRRISRIAKDFDLIWFYKQRCEALFPHVTWRCSVLDIDDVLSRYERATIRVIEGVFDRALALRRVVSWRRREKLFGKRFTVLAVCSPDDKKYLRDLNVNGPIHVIPNGFEKPRTEPIRCQAIPPRIGFIGFLDYFPNREGIQWFVKMCWPLIKREIPEVRLRLVGRGSDGPFKPSGPDVDGLGWLDDPGEEIRTWSLMAVPIRIGAGTRVKIAHGFSQKCPIVSTSFGAQGYDAVNAREMCLADSPEEFAKACVSVIREPRQAQEMANRAWRDFLEKWSWDAMRPRVWAAAEECLLSEGEKPALIPHQIPNDGALCKETI